MMQVSGLVITLQSGLGTPTQGCGYSDHVLAQARLAGLLRCMSTQAGSGQQRLDHVLAQAKKGL